MSKSLWMTVLLGAAFLGGGLTTATAQQDDAVCAEGETQNEAGECVTDPIESDMDQGGAAEEGAMDGGATEAGGEGGESGSDGGSGGGSSDGGSGSGG